MPEYVVKLKVDGKTKTHQTIAPSVGDAVEEAKGKHREAEDITVVSAERMEGDYVRSVG